MLVSISMKKPLKLSVDILKSIFKSNLYRSQDAFLLSKLPVIPRGRQFRDLKGTSESVALKAHKSNKLDSLYIGFRLELSNSEVWTYTPILFNVSGGKVVDYHSKSTKWSDFKDVKFIGIELPEDFIESRKYKNLWFNKAFIMEHSPLALIEVIPKEIKK